MRMDMIARYTGIILLYVAKAYEVLRVRISLLN